MAIRCEHAHRLELRNLKKTYVILFYGHFDILLWTYQGDKKKRFFFMILA